MLQNTAGCRYTQPTNNNPTPHSRLPIPSLLIAICSLLFASCQNPLIVQISEPKTVTFESNGGSYVESQTVYKGYPIKRPTNPVKSGYAFDAWYSDSGFQKGWNFNTVPKSNMTLYANWNAIGVNPGVEIITTVAVTVTGPATGEAPAATANGTGNFSIEAVSWIPDDNTFQGGTAYTVSVTLWAHNGYTFASALTVAAINGNNASVANNTGNTVTLSYTFAATGDKAVTAITVKAQPAQLIYTHGDTLNLSGLAVTLAYDNGETEDVALDSFGSTNISASPAHGEVLSYTEHNNQPVIVSYGARTAETARLTVNMASITSVAITVTGPATGETPNTTVSGSGNFTPGEVSWSPSHSPFQGGVAYTASVTLTVHQDYTFESTLTAATINGQTATLSNNTGATVTLSYEFAPTGKAVTAIDIKTQPTNLIYTDGNTLNLTGLEVTLTYNDNTTEDVALDEFDSKNISTAPQNGIELSRSTHNNTTVTVSIGSFSTSAGILTVNPKHPDLGTTVDPIPDQTYTGSPIEPTVTVRDGTTTLTLDTDYEVFYSNNINAGTQTAIINILGKGNYTGGWSLNFTIKPADGAEVSAPTAAAIGVDSITLNPVPAPANTGQTTVEYAYGTTSTAPTSNWKTETTLTGLTAGTTYYFFARSKANDNYNAGAPSTGTSIATIAPPSNFSASSDTIYGIAYGGGRFVAGGTGKMAYSSDGVTWTALAAENHTFNSSKDQVIAIAYGNGTFVVVGRNTDNPNNSNTGKMAFSTNTGITWTAVADNTFNTIAPTASIQSVAHNGITGPNSRFVAGGNVGKMAYSSDGVTWTAVTSSPFGQSNIICIAYGNNGWVAGGNDGKMATSTDGIAWTVVDDSTFGTFSIQCIAYGGGRFIAVGANGKMATSTDGTTWTVVDTITFDSSQINAIAYGGGKFVAGGNDGKMATSTDGITWTAMTGSPFGTSAVQCIVYGDGKFIAGGGSGKIAYIY